MSTKIKEETWVVIPAYNEEKYIETVLKKISAFSKNIILIDDGSSDKTAQLSLKYTPHVLIHDLNLGKGGALKTGCDYAFETMNAQSVILVDGDDQHDSKELFNFDQKLQEGQNLILGTRSLWEMPVLRSMGNRIISALVVLFFGKYIPDILSGYKAFTKKTYQQISWYSRGYSVELEIACRIAKNNIQFVTVPTTTIYHDFDRGMTVLDTLGMLSQIIVLRLQL